MVASRPVFHRPRPASIVPPPFGSGYQFVSRLSGDTEWASIVPPPFGSGYQFVSKLSGDTEWASIVPPPFGSGYHKRNDW